ncbi:cupin [Candidatus Woesearchaeota archaeon]|nr:cupin [Candidatus Woesearchaeota archaeon]
MTLREEASVPMKTVPKPWGREDYIHISDKWAFKFLVFNKGHRYSLQYHDMKDETFHLLKGKMKLILGKKENPDKLEESIFNIGETVHITPGTIHRVEALEDSTLVEVGTSELLDVVRLADDYSREGTNKP